MGHSEPILRFRVCEQTFSVACVDRTLASYVSRTFGALGVPRQDGGRVTEVYRISRPMPNGGVIVETSTGRTALDNACSVLPHLDKHLITRLQHERPDLYFLHGAAIAIKGRAAAVIAPSGSGKSTLAFTLIQHGVTYLSDELVPVDVGHNIVYPYPRAICLKSPPSKPYQLRSGTVRCGSLRYVPASTGVMRVAPMPIGALFFLDRTAPANPCEPMTKASAVAHLIANSLNSLAHQQWGVDAAFALAARVPCFALNSTHLENACDAVIAVMNHDAS